MQIMQKCNKSHTYMNGVLAVKLQATIAALLTGAADQLSADLRTAKCHCSYSPVMTAIQ